jgi:hypothetical protein
MAERLPPNNAELLAIPLGDESTRSQWYLCDESGRFVSMLFLTDAEYSTRPDQHLLTKTLPPQAAPDPAVTLQRGKDELRGVIDRERDRRTNDPLILLADGTRLDADALSIDRLSKKLLALQSYEAQGKEAPADECFWRDYDNNTLTFGSHSEYKTWLSEFATTLDQRGTQAFIWSVTKKAELDAITSAADLDSFNPLT